MSFRAANAVSGEIETLVESYLQFATTWELEQKVGTGNCLRCRSLLGIESGPRYVHLRRFYTPKDYSDLTLELPLLTLFAVADLRSHVDEAYDV